MKSYTKIKGNGSGMIREPLKWGKKCVFCSKEIRRQEYFENIIEKEHCLDELIEEEEYITIMRVVRAHTDCVKDRKRIKAL